MPANYILLIAVISVALILTYNLKEPHEKFSFFEKQTAHQHVIDEIHTRMAKIVEFCKSKNIFTDLVHKFPFVKFREVEKRVLESDPTLTSYSVNKKDVYFCLKHREHDTLYDMNLLTYVATHELAHVATKSVGHTEEWKSNFDQLLKIATKLELYTPIKEAREYCGMQIHAF